MVASHELTAAAIAAISPFLPYLGKAGEAFAKSGGEAAWQAAENIWQKIVGASSNDAKLSGAVSLLLADPVDEDSLSILAKSLESHLERNPDLAEALLTELGGQPRVQEMVAERGSRLSGNEQELRGSGRQTISASDDSVIENSRQSSRS